LRSDCDAVTVIGSGYVGLVSGACLADFGHRVSRIDKDAQSCSAFPWGCADLRARFAGVVQSNVRQSRLDFSTPAPQWVNRNKDNALSYKTLPSPGSKTPAAAGFV
jgi:UDP-glucose 6-dehydrogenase